MCQKEILKKNYAIQLTNSYIDNKYVQNMMNIHYTDTYFVV